MQPERRIQQPSPSLTTELSRPKNAPQVCSECAMGFATGSHARRASGVLGSFGS